MALTSLMLYGSVARGDTSILSDVDMLGLDGAASDSGSTNDVKRHFAKKGTLSVYSETQLSTMALEGDLFVWHLKTEGIIIYDEDRRLENVLAEFVLRKEYERERRQGAEVGWMLLCSEMPLDTPDAVQAMLYAVRTIAISYLAERGTPAFSRDAVLDFFPDNDLGEIWRSKYNSAVSAQDLARLRNFLTRWVSWRPRWAETTLSVFLNSPDVSIVAFNKALRLLRRQPSVGYGEVPFTAEGLVPKERTSKALDTLRKEVLVGQGVVMRQPLRFDYRRDLARSLTHLADLHHSLGDLDKARRCLSDSLSIFESLVKNSLVRPEFRHDYSGALRKMSEMLRILGRSEAACTFLEMSFSILLSLVNELPTRLDMRFDLFKVCSEMSEIQASMGQLHEAQASRSRAVFQMRWLVKAESERVDFRQKLSESYMFLADVELTLGIASAQRNYELALAVQIDLARWKPERADIQSELLRTYRKLAAVRARSGENLMALQYHESALIVLARMVEHDSGRLELRRDVARAHFELGEQYVKAGDNGTAAKHCQLGVSLLHGLEGRVHNRERGDLQREIAAGYRRVGELQFSLGDRDAARDSFARGLSIFQNLTHGSSVVNSLYVEVALCLERMALLDEAQSTSLLRYAADLRRANYGGEKQEAEAGRGLVLALLRLSLASIKAGAVLSGRRLLEEAQVILGDLRTHGGGVVDDDVQLVVFAVESLLMSNG